ncbi:stage II sporulation protein M [Alicyclobacillus tolerans]|uniref:stage II sporulation protein M n=1 Tax=Alicyclobacillus tolerans TaxID=90970 RepID=UPI001F0055FD|nr:stage II sporulation protein M [Alicyclobacillus tolerans]MCF8563667.1 stage II sporulation protein M [Alicyclobacillus tolerans]
MAVPTGVRVDFGDLWHHIRTRVMAMMHVWTFLIAVSVCGIAFGAVVAGELNQGDTAVLSNAVSHLLEAIGQHQLARPGALWWQRVISDGQLLALMWLFGVSVIGLPFVVILIFLRSFSIGFAIGFTVIQFGWKGLFVSSILIFLHQIISMTALIFAGVFAIRFSAGILRQAFPLHKLSLQFLQYTGLFVLCGAVLMVGALIQAYVAPALLNGVFLGG